jgi:hypothetical protein
VEEFDEVALRVGDERHPDPGFGRRAQRHDRPRRSGLEISLEPCGNDPGVTRRTMIGSPEAQICLAIYSASGAEKISRWQRSRLGST